MNSGCLDPCMMRIMSENVTKPAKDRGWQTRLSHKSKKIRQAA